MLAAHRVAGLTATLGVVDDLPTDDASADGLLRGHPATVDLPAGTDFLAGADLPAGDAGLLARFIAEATDHDTTKAGTA